MQKKLLITFDYELFLGNRSGYVEECMIDPTNKMLEVLKKYGVRAIYFVDTTYLLRLQEQSKINEKCKSDFQKVANQILRIIGEGHFVYPHVHPHWLDAKYDAESNQWSLNSTEKYLFGNISEAERIKVFDGSVEVLKSIIHPVFPDYKINAFRAGGWSIQPFGNFFPYFNKHDFKYEFSVLKDFYQFTDAQYFDFSLTPLKEIYTFREDVCKEESNGPFTQYSISSIYLSPLKSLANRVWLKIHLKTTGDHTFHKGEGQPSRVLKGIRPASSNGKDLSTTSWERIAVELLTIVKLRTYLSYFEKNSFMHFISHPKMITGHNLAVFDKFLSKVFNKYAIETDFHMMKPE